MVDLLLDLRNIKKDFGPQAKVLHCINLEVHQGSFSAIIGPSGSGKSTLLNVIGLLDKPSSGDFRFLGADIVEMPPAQLTKFRGSKIGFVFQFHHLLPAFSAVENVMLPLVAHHGRLRHDFRAKALGILDQVGMTDKADSRPSELSGGQQQRVAIARALVTNPPLVLADEPTGNLDTKNANEIFSLLRKLNNDVGMALMVVTHDSRLADRCDRIIEVVDGQILSDQKHNPSQS
jgi:lipoprotein-releasing system ATP-binding protein